MVKVGVGWPLLLAAWLLLHLVCTQDSPGDTCSADGVDCTAADRPLHLTPTCPDPPPRPRLGQQEPQAWQEVEGRRVLVFSAYVERRAAAGGSAVRLVASGWQAEYNEIGPLYCQLWYPDLQDMVVTGPAEYQRIYPSTLHPDMWVAHFILCPMRPEGPHPYAVSVTHAPCATPRNTLLVLGPPDTPPAPNTFAVCISPLYNYFRNWTMIAEWFEVHRLLGAGEIIIYSHSVAPDTRRLLEHYAGAGAGGARVTVVQWPFPHHLKANVWCQRGALNDCLYRAARHHRYVAVTDLDEILVPREFDKWPELLAKVDRPDLGAFLFQHAYFRRNSSGEEPYLITQQSLWRTPEVTPPGKVRCKTMYKTDMAVKIDLHFPYQLLPTATEYMVPPSEGMLHHYRCDPMETFRKHPEKFTFVEDKYMNRYGERLKDRVSTVLQEL